MSIRHRLSDLDLRVAGPRRVVARQWQAEALPICLAAIAESGVATVAAAPGSGKTFFAGMLFKALLRDVDRMVVIVPRAGLVQQWARVSWEDSGIQLRPNHPLERLGQDGVVVTYQSLSPATLVLHQARTRTDRTLVVLDEVHHVGESVIEGERAAWAHFVAELVGGVERGLQVAAVLNLSGTLWRSKPSERISTVHYDPAENATLVSVVDYEVSAGSLIRQRQLRPVDLYRRGVSVTLVDTSTSARLVSNIADLSRSETRRVAMRGLGSDDLWRANFVAAVMERLEAVAAPGFHPKALIVASSQEEARAFRATAAVLASERRSASAVMLAVSDDPEAAEVMEAFRLLRGPGILCTVDMAGEGYDCPEIVVVGYCSVKRTALYIRQVVARAQRVTPYERQTGRILHAAVVIPDLADLVELMSAVLDPMRHRPWVQRHEGFSVGGEPLLESPEALAEPREPGYILEGLQPHVEDCDAVVAGTMGDEGGQLGLIYVLEPRRPVNVACDIPASNISANVTSPDGEAPQVPIEAEVAALRSELAYLAGWVQRQRDARLTVSAFQIAVNAAGGFGRGGRETASVEQLRRALDHARALVGAYCERASLMLPRAMGPAGR